MKDSYSSEFNYYSSIIHTQVNSLCELGRALICFLLLRLETKQGQENVLEVIANKICQVYS